MPRTGRLADDVEHRGQPASEKASPDVRIVHDSRPMGGQESCIFALPSVFARIVSIKRGSGRENEPPRFGVAYQSPQTALPHEEGWLNPGA
jgi:hypothetical protein